MSEHKKDEEITLADKINDFLLKNRKPVLAVIVLICTVVIAVSVYFSISAKRKTNALASAEKIIFDLEKFKKDFMAEKAKTELENASETASDEKDKQEEKAEEKEIPAEIKSKEDEAALELHKIIEANKGSYAAYLAASVIADIYFSRKDYEKALENYSAGAEMLKDSYVAGAALFNAGVCAEELDKKEDALSFYKKAAMIENFPLRPRAMFNEGRLHEALKNIESAIEAYKNLSEKYPDNEWSLIGKSRIIILEIEKNKQM